MFANRICFTLAVMLCSIQEIPAQMQLHYMQETNQLTMDCSLQRHSSSSIGIGEGGIIVKVTDINGQAHVLYNSIGCSQYSLQIKEESAQICIFCFPEIMYTSDCACEDQPKPESESADFQIKILLTPDTIMGEMSFPLNHFSTPKWLTTNNAISNVEKSVPYYYDMIPSFFKDNKDVKSILSFIAEYDKEVKRKELTPSYPEYEYYRDFFRTIIPYLKSPLLSFEELTCLGNSLSELGERIQIIKE